MCKEIWFYHKKKIIYALATISLLSLLYVTRIIGNIRSIPYYYTIQETITENEHTAVVTDGVYLYDVNYDNREGVTNKRLPVTQSLEPAMDLRTSSVYFEINKIDDISYDGTTQDGLSYINRLMEKGYKTKSIYRDRNYVDITMVYSVYTVRVIVTSSGAIQIFALNDRKKAITPPYIIEG